VIEYLEIQREIAREGVLAGSQADCKPVAFQLRVRNAQERRRRGL
jgi:hypothetical protein